MTHPASSPTAWRPGAAALAGAILAALLTSAPALAKSCADYDKEILAAQKAADADTAARLFQEAFDAQACGGTEQAMLARNAALAFYAKAYAGAKPDTELLRRGLKLAQPWQLLAALADEEATKGNFAEASSLYQDAITDLRDEKSNPVAPPVNLIAGLVKKAEEARLLSPVYLVKKDVRNNAPTGLACPGTRGYTVTKTALPIEFNYREITFTDKGAAAIADMLDYLTKQGSPDIHLVGHTDPRGSDDVNKQLSERRAATVASHLKSKGYKGKITTEGKGESQRFEADDPGRYSEEQLFQLDRRVELDRKSGGRGCTAN